MSAGKFRRHAMEKKKDERRRKTSLDFFLKERREHEKWRRGDDAKGDLSRDYLNLAAKIDLKKEEQAFASSSN